MTKTTIHGWRGLRDSAKYWLWFGHGSTSYGSSAIRSIRYKCHLVQGSSRPVSHDSVKICGEMEYWELCNFSTPTDPQSYGSWDNIRTHNHWEITQFPIRWPSGDRELLGLGFWVSRSPMVALLGIIQSQWVSGISSCYNFSPGKRIHRWRSSSIKGEESDSDALSRWRWDRPHTVGQRLASAMQDVVRQESARWW